MNWDQSGEQWSGQREQQNRASATDKDRESPRKRGLAAFHLGITLCPWKEPRMFVPVRASGACRRLLRHTKQPVGTRAKGQAECISAQPKAKPTRQRLCEMREGGGLYSRGAFSSGWPHVKQAPRAPKSWLARGTLGSRTFVLCKPLDSYRHGSRGVAIQVEDHYERSIGDRMCTLMVKSKRLCRYV